MFERRVLFFLWLGPIIGAAVIAIANIALLFLTTNLADAAANALVFLGSALSFGIPVAFIAGAIPALVVGALFSFARSAGWGGWQLNTALAVVGGAVTQVFLVGVGSAIMPVSDPGEDSITSHTLWFSRGAFVFGVAGAISASVCSAIRQRRERNPPKASNQRAGSIGG